MSQQSVPPLIFDFLADRPVFVQPQEGQVSSDAGLLPIAQFDRRWNYTARMAQCLHDPTLDPREDGRKPRVATHQRQEMLRQRLFGMLADYEDCNDHDTLRDDPVLKLVSGRLPQDRALASQPTLSRFENAITIPCLYKLLDLLVTTGIERLKQENGGVLPASVVLDLDATDDPAHGQQQLVLFNGFYEQYQYLPLIISEPTTKHVFLAWLRPGTLHAAMAADDDLMRVVRALRAVRPDIRIHVRGDAGFGMPWIYKVCEENGLSYTLGFSANARLKNMTQALISEAVRLYELTGQKQRRFACFAYQADAWSHPRTVVAKAECHAGGTNLRFVVTNLPPHAISAEEGQHIYDDYIQRGESEQRMDELKNGLHADRLSCHRFLANFFRLLVHTGAYNLLNAMRRHKDLPPVLHKGQPQTWRTHVIKVAAVVVQTARRIVVKLSSTWPWWPLYRTACQRALGLAISRTAVT